MEERKYAHKTRTIARMVVAGRTRRGWEWRGRAVATPGVRWSRLKRFDAARAQQLPTILPPLLFTPPSLPFPLSPYSHLSPPLSFCLFPLLPSLSPLSLSLISLIFCELHISLVFLTFYDFFQPIFLSSSFSIVAAFFCDHHPSPSRRCCRRHRYRWSTASRLITHSAHSALMLSGPWRRVSRFKLTGQRAVRQRPGKREKEWESRGGEGRKKEWKEERSVLRWGEARAYILRDSCTMSGARLLVATAVTMMLLPLVGISRWYARVSLSLSCGVFLKISGCDFSMASSFPLCSN